MPRYARLHAPGAAVHLIGRFVDHQFRLAGPAERAIYLEILGRTLARSDWVLLAYALMSSHVHLALLTGEDPPEVLLKRLHTAVARALNTMHGRFGPVFGERATTVTMPSSQTGALAAYIHNNPGRSGLVVDASESSWTSHRAWLGLEPAPDFLDVRSGLRLAGFDTSIAGRSAFDVFVRERRDQTRDSRLTGRDAPEIRRTLRQRLALPLELASSVHELDDTFRHALIHAGSTVPKWDGDLDLVLHAVTSKTGVSSEELRSLLRTRRVAIGRRIFAVTSVVRLRRRPIEVAAAIGLSPSGVSKLLRHASAVAPLAREVEQTVREHDTQPTG